jgi:hypothetical protein
MVTPKPVEDVGTRVGTDVGTLIHHQYWKGMERLPLQILDVRRFMVVHLQIVSLRLSEILAQLGASCSNKFLHLQLPPSPNNALIQKQK